MGLRPETSSAHAVRRRVKNLDGMRPAGEADVRKELQTMGDQLNIDRNRTAVLIMDYQNDIVGRIADGQGVLERAAAVIRGSRRANMPVIYVVVRFREGYPEVSLRNKGFGAVKESGRLQEGTQGAEIHPAVLPGPGDIIVTKRRVSAFSTTDLV